MRWLRLRQCTGIVFVITLVLLEIYYTNQLSSLLGQRRPLSPTLVLYSSDEVLRFPPNASHREYRLLATIGKPFVIFMGTTTTPVRIIASNLTFLTHPDNHTDVCLHFRAQNLGVDPVVVFHQNDYWRLTASEYLYYYVSEDKPALILQPLDTGHGAVKFTVDSSLKPKGILWGRWTGAGWMSIVIVWAIS